MLSPSPCTEGDDDGQLFGFAMGPLPVRLHSGPPPRLPQDLATVKDDEGSHGLGRTQSLKRRVPWETEMIEYPPRAKSIKVTHGQSAGSVPGLERHENDETRDRLPSQEDSQSDGDSRSLFDMMGEEPVESPSLDPQHPFSAFKNELVEYGLRVASATFNPAETEEQRVEFQSDSEDDDLVAVQLYPRYLCPFYANDKERHRDCLKVADLTNILDVKRHVCRNHRLPHYCPICFEILPTPTELDSHIRARACSGRANIAIEGVGRDQVEPLAKVSKRMPPTQQWYAIFNIVLPQTPLPNTAHLSGNIESAICHLRVYWKREGARIVSEFVATRMEDVFDSSPGIDDEKLLASYESVPDEERSLGALHREVIADMIGKLLNGSGDEQEDKTGKTNIVIETLLAGLQRMGVITKPAQYHGPRRRKRRCDKYPVTEFDGTLALRGVEGG